METITTWAKENYDLICLLVGVIGVIIAFISLIYEIKKKKEQKEKESEEEIKSSICTIFDCRRRYSRSKKLKILLVFCSLIRTFARSKRIL